MYLLHLCITAVLGNPNGLAATPPMGWRSWNFMKQNVSQERILQQVAAVTASRNGKPSLLELGYNHVGIDDGWQACGAGVNHSFHNATGYPIINLTRFPSMLAMNRAAHKEGVKMGWYQNNCGCNEAAQFGSIGGHVAQDARMTADLEFDSIKVDGCGPSQNISAWTEALNATERPILLEDCLTKKYTKQGDPNAPVPLKEVFAECPGNFFRLSSDIGPQFYSTMYNLIFTYETMKPYNTPPVHVTASRPGCWTYSDMLEVGNGMNLVESRTHFAAWAVSSSPLVLGFDLANTTLYDELYDIVGNPNVIAINQAWAGSSGEPVVNSTSYFEAPTEHGAGGKMSKHPNIAFPVWQAWSKPLGSGKLAVLVINISTEPQDVSILYATLGIHVAPAGVTHGIASKNRRAVTAADAWTGDAVSKGVVGKDGLIIAAIPPHDSVFLVLTPTKSA